MVYNVFHNLCLCQQILYYDIIWNFDYVFQLRISQERGEMAKNISNCLGKDGDGTGQGQEEVCDGRAVAESKGEETAEEGAPHQIPR